RILRSTFPVIEIVWPEGRVRVSPRQMSWRGLPDQTHSSPENAARLVDALVRASGGAVLDSGFVGQNVPVEIHAVAPEPLAGADGDKTELCERSAAAAAMAFRKGLYPPAAAGTLQTVHSNAASLIPRASAAVTSSAIPWMRPGRLSRLRLGLFPWLLLGPI